MRGTLRQRLTISVVAATAVMLTLLVFGFNLALRTSLDGDANRLLEARAQAALESVDVNDGQLDVNEGSDEGAPDSLVWIYDGAKVVEHPQAGGSLDAEAAQLASRGEGKIDDDATDIRLYALPVTENGSRVGTVVSGVSLEPYETTASRAAVASIVLGLIMIVLIALTTRLVVSRALKPVAKMTAEAADWSEHDLDRRFNEGQPNDELTRLAATFDIMLERMAFMLRHERNFSAELSHELRTPLSAISAEAELALNRERSPGEYRGSLERISERSTELTRILETLLDVAKAEGRLAGDESVDALDAIESTLKSLKSLSDKYEVQVNVEESGGSYLIQAGPETVRRILAPIIENALTYADSSVTVRLGTGDRTVEVTITDDGPGFLAGEPEGVFEPGVRGNAARNEYAPAGTGLGLPLSRRLARANGGEVRAESRASASGGHVVVVLPEAIDPA